VPPGLGEADAEAWRTRIERELRALTRDADTRAGDVA
jgi:hypothetical protein